ncbi:RHS repeat domain-containing protein [Aquimarina gracilis]|uniref:RHS repeat domain-containing protein n=1 Tax=Aquimarina gracilis TaxID=874422 RepID=A0ABU5ZP81_9FLAO|nr:RHS repeat domain-containing protein [Aquimarina gracilis]MEB3343933.1 RHS repeat domain-containing protein [Aquimarina gracilis]
MKQLLGYVMLMTSIIGSAQTSGTGTSQDQFDANALVQVPNSPEAEAFTRYGNIPISYYTGKPNVSVPIHTIQGREFSVPISVSYDASAIKVQSISTSVGAGWNLQAGGVVSRQVHDLPDDALSGAPANKISDPDIISFNNYLSTLRSPENDAYLNFENYEHELSQINKYRNIRDDHGIGEVDLMPDIFNFSAPGLSGSIVIDYNTGDAISLKDSDIKATYTTNNLGSIQSWVITNTLGTVYHFTIPEETTTTFSSEANEGTRVYNSSWYLSKIVSTNGKDVFEFNYSPAKYWDQPQIYYNQQAARNPLSNCGRTLTYDPTQHTSITTSNMTDFRIKQPILSSISLNNIDRIVFYHNTNRQDLSGRKKLDQIAVTYGAKRLKTFYLHHSYFTSNSSHKTEEDYRLKLDSISIEGNNTSGSGIVSTNPTQKQSYRFEYRGGNILPSRKSLAIDNQGYYNGSNGEGNTSLIPKYIDATGKVYLGANREPLFSAKIKGMLQEIYYPTGGSTSFELNENRYELGTIQEIETFSQSLGSVGSGSDPTAQESDYNCDDGFWEFPKTSTVDFTVDNDEIMTENTGYFYSATSEGNYAQDGRMFFMAIYKSTPATAGPSPNYTMLENGCIEVHGFDITLTLCPGECKDVPFNGGTEPSGFTVCYDNYVNNSTPDNSKTYCEIKAMIDSGSSDIVYYTHGIPTTGSTQIVFSSQGNWFLPPGSYKVFIANSYLGKTVSMSRRYFKKVERTLWNNSPLLNKIVDKTNEGQQHIRTFDYQDFSVQQYTQLHTIKRTAGNIGAECYKSPYEGYYDTLERQTSNIYGKTPNEITFPKVLEVLEDTAGNPLGSTLYEYYDQEFFVSNSVYPGISNLYYPKLGEPYVATNPLIGQLKKKTVYDTTGKIVTQSQNLYDFEKSVVTTGTSFYGGTTWVDICTVAVPGYHNPSLKQLTYMTSTHGFGRECASTGDNLVISGWRTVQGNSDNNIRFYKFKTRLNESLNKDYFYNANQVDSVVQKVTYSYGTNHNMPIETKTSVGQNNTRITRTLYPLDLQNPTAAEEALIIENRIATPIEITDFFLKNGDPEKQLSKRKTVFNNTKWAGNIFPEKIQTAKAAGNLEDRIIYTEYDHGNPVEVQAKDGTPISYIWGYKNQYPIAKLENLTYAALSSTEISNLKTLSDSDNSESSENTLRTALNALRDSYPDATITTYTYDPQVGVTSMTDPRGYTMYYTYDDLGRLHHVKDAQGHLVSENKYHYKN